MTAPTPPLTAAQVAEIRARVDAATEGPWDFWHAEDGRMEMFVPNGTMSTETVLEFKDHDDCPECSRLSLPDAEFIAHARTDVPALIADRARLLERLAGVEAERDAWKRTADARSTVQARVDYLALREAVEALADEMERGGYGTAHLRLRALLAEHATPPSPPGPSRRSTVADAITIPDPESLRAHLDALNEAGTRYTAAGVDARQQPFLIALSGCYAESEDVIYGSPWDSEVDWNTGRLCDDCNAANLHGMESLAFPVTILATAEQAGTGAQGEAGEDRE